MHSIGDLFELVEEIAVRRPKRLAINNEWSADDDERRTSSSTLDRLID